jgi:SpoVK/Ycf46/Vps4 family AAA+-type ATPase
MEQDGFPRSLLKLPVEQRLDYFVGYTMAHPHLLDAFQELMQAIYKSPGTSLIFLVGPTGVGKTTLLHRLIQKVIEATLPDLEVDKGRIPIFGIESKAPEFSQFEWKDFYIRLLKALNEPLIDQKVSMGDSKSRWRRAVESALINRQPDAFYIDEAHHLAMLSRGQRLKDQPEVLKSLANLANVKIVLAGTYNLLPLIDLGDQLCRRSKTIHFSRYQAEHKKEAKAFKSVLQTFQNHLPLPKMPDLVSHWEFLYERSLGNVGMLKDWLAETLSVVLEKNPEACTITLKDLNQQARPVPKCLTIIKEINKGEDKFKETSADLEKLRKALKLGQKSTQLEGIETNQADEQQKAATSKRKGGKVGQPKPRRYAVGGSEHDGE